MAVGVEWVEDLFAAFGPVAVKRMFGGAGVFADGLMIGLVFGETIYLRTDEALRAAFIADGSEPFRFDKPSAGKTITTGYYSLPARLFDDPDELAHCARQALTAARENAGAKKARPRSSRKRAAAKGA